jgi:hypothetical protein
MTIGFEPSGADEKPFHYVYVLRENLCELNPQIKEIKYYVDYAA